METIFWNLFFENKMFDMKTKPSKNKTHNYYEETLDNQGYQDYQVLGSVTSNIGLTSYFAPNSSNFAPNFQVTFFANMSSKMVRFWENISGISRYFMSNFALNSGMYFFPISHLFLILITLNDKQRQPHLCC